MSNFNIEDLTVFLVSPLQSRDFLRGMVDLQALELRQGEVFHRDVQHEVPALLGASLDTQPELVVEHGDQVPGHMHVKLHHVSPVLYRVLHGGQSVLLDGAAAVERIYFHLLFFSS